MILHTLTYFIFGIIMSNIFDYKTIFEQPIIGDFMRPLDSPYVLAGPFLQPLRGFLFALGLWPIRKLIFEHKYGWLIMWNIFIVFGILGPAAAAPCSMEGVIYSKLPVWFHLMGLPEIIFQTLSLSLLLTWWVRKTSTKKTTVSLSRKKAALQRFLFAVMISCFAYIGYAVGSILSAKLAGKHINLNQGAVDIKGQLTFVFAFTINVLAIFIFTAKFYFGKLSFWWFFLIFWIIDSLSVFIYRTFAYGHMPVFMTLIIGLFPAAIILLCYKLNYKNYALLNNSSATE
jgi:hypothetical protein